MKFSSKKIGLRFGARASKFYPKLPAAVPMRSTTLLSLLATTAAAATSNATWHMDASNDAGGICSYFDGILPSYCECKDANLGGTLNCTISMGVAGYHIDTISVVGNVLPCSTPASLSIVVYEYDLGFSYTLGSIKAGEEWHEPVRLLSLFPLSFHLVSSLSHTSWISLLLRSRYLV